MQFLVIAKLHSDVKPEQVAPLAKAEALKVWEMLTQDVLRSIHFIASPGAVLMFEAPDEKTARSYVDQLPVVGAGLVSVELFALMPYTGFAKLFDAASA